MASDSIIALAVKLAQFSQYKQIAKSLTVILPPHWSKSNPIDLMRDAKAQRYEAAAEACFNDENVDGFIDNLYTQGSSDRLQIAEKILDIYKRKSSLRPYFTSFMGL